MKINDVAKLTKLSQKTIRYYEERGLINPDIQMIRGRKFRDYSAETLKRITSIATLRKLLFSIDEIKLLIEHPEQIDFILLDYKKRIENDIEEKTLILKTLCGLTNPTSFTDIDSLSFALTDISKNYNLPNCDMNPDFSNFDSKEPKYHQNKESRIHTKHSIFAKKANSIEMFILELLWIQNSMDFTTIAHKCMERGILSDSDVIAKIIRRMCRRKLIKLTDRIYVPLVSQDNIEFRNFDLMVQTAYNGSPNRMIYTPPATPTSFGGGK